MVERVVCGDGGEGMTLISHIKCDVCNQPILDDSPPHQTRQVYTRIIGKDQNGDDVEEVLERRDLCDGCATRVAQTITVHLQNCAWILDGFEVARK